MGKRAGRKLTRAVKIINPQIFLKKEIGKGIESGAPLKEVAYLISTKFHIQKQKALKMVMAEFDVIARDWMDTGEPSIKTANGQVAPVKYASLSLS